MLEKNDPPTRGRPKTLNRDHVLRVAMMSYWSDGPTSVSIGEVCQRAGVSKPSLYREFKNDDGLKVAVLDLYRSAVLVPFFKIMSRRLPFRDAVAALIAFTIQDRAELGIPNGCLQVAMRACSQDLGATTAQKVDLLRRETLAHYEDWIETAKLKGELETTTPTKAVALFCDAQNSSAMRMQREGVPNEIIEQILKLAFTALID